MRQLLPALYVEAALEARRRLHKKTCARGLCGWDRDFQEASSKRPEAFSSSWYSGCKALPIVSSIRGTWHLERLKKIK